MKLLILGAGGHGCVCGEIATSLGWNVAFLDDNVSGVHGRLAAFVAMGNPEVREQWIRKLKEKGYKLPTLVSGNAVVSNTAQIEECTVVMAGAIIQSNVTIGRGGITSSGAIIDHDSIVGEFVHVNARAIVPSMSKVENKVKINYGEVWRNV